MSLGSTWWDGTGSPSYADVKLEPEFGSASGSYGSIVSGGQTYIRYQASSLGHVCALGGAAGSESDDTKKTGTPEFGQIYSTDNDTDFSRFDTLFVSTAASGYTNGRSSLYFPWDDSATIISVVQSASATERELRFWMPDCWLGTVAEICGSILVINGAGLNYIDTSAFSDADDGQSAYGTGSDTITCFYRREPGQTYADTIKALVRHSWDLLTIDMAGKVALFRRDGISSSYTVASLASEDGVVSVKWRMAHEHLANSIYCGYGRWFEGAPVLKPEDGGGTTYTLFPTMNEISCPSEYLDAWELYEDTTSQTKYGTRECGNSQAKYYSGQREEAKRAFHLPYLTQANPASGAADAESARDNFMERLDVDCQLRREITVVQDFRGLDYDVGWKVADVAVTRDSATVDDTRCIKKTIDFNDFSVVSVLLEEPS